MLLFFQWTSSLGFMTFWNKPVRRIDFLGQATVLRKLSEFWAKVCICPGPQDMGGVNLHLGTSLWSNRFCCFFAISHLLNFGIWGGVFCIWCFHSRSTVPISHFLLWGKKKQTTIFSVGWGQARSLERGCSPGRHQSVFHGHRHRGLETRYKPWKSYQLLFARIKKFKYQVV